MERFEEIRTWYQTKARPALEEHGADGLADLDVRLKELKILVSGPQPPTKICILGDAGAGKSTLLNALVADERTVVPQGGVGPLTAQATEVVYAADPYIEVEYFSGKQLNQLRHILETELRRRLQGIDSNAPAADALTLTKTEQFDATLPEGPEGSSEVAPKSWTRRYAAFASYLDFTSKSMGLR